MNKIDLIAIAKRATDGAHMCLWSKGNYQYEIEVIKSDYFTESDNFTCDYSDAKSKFEDMAEDGKLTLCGNESICVNDKAVDRLLEDGISLTNYIKNGIFELE